MIRSGIISPPNKSDPPTPSSLCGEGEYFLFPGSGGKQVDEYNVYSVFDISEVLRNPVSLRNRVSKGYFL
jgi:hypothetical protein